MARVNDQEQDDLKVFLRHRTALVGIASPLVGRHRAEDVVQEAWLRFSAADQPKRQPASLLYRIVRNLAIDIARRSRWEVGGEVGEDILRDAEETTPNIEHQLAQRDDLRRVAEALAELPDDTQRAFELHRFEGRTYAEIARTLRISQGQAHKLVHRAIAHCLARLDQVSTDREDRDVSFV